MLCAGEIVCLSKRFFHFTERPRHGVCDEFSALFCVVMFKRQHQPDITGLTQILHGQRNAEKALGQCAQQRNVSGQKKLDSVRVAALSATKKRLFLRATF